jgi:hypothetical protein
LRGEHEARKYAKKASKRQSELAFWSATKGTARPTATQYKIGTAKVGQQKRERQKDGGKNIKTDIFCPHFFAYRLVFGEAAELAGE